MGADGASAPRQPRRPRGAAADNLADDANFEEVDIDSRSFVSNSSRRAPKKGKENMQVAARAAG